MKDKKITVRIPLPPPTKFHSPVKPAYDRTKEKIQEKKEVQAWHHYLD